MYLDNMNGAELEAELTRLEAQYAAHQAAGLTLDITRGKPGSSQLDLSDALDGLLGGDYTASDGTDTRGYGGLDGLPEAKRLGAALLDVDPDAVIVGGNSSLTLMYLYLMHCHHYGPGAGGGAWRDTPDGARFLCPVPGYDRHFGICEDLGLAMVPVALTGEGPDMDQVESLLADDPGIKGIWCVPKYANPSGEIYAEETVRRVAELGRLAGPGFQVMWDNAYSVHDLGAPKPLANVMRFAASSGTQDNIVLFGSTSKITFAGAGLAFMAGSPVTLASFRKRLEVLTIGPDKVNQLRHARMFKDGDAIRALMRRHAEILRPKFQAVQQRLHEGLGNLGLARWSDPEGGYFVSVDTIPGIAKQVVQLAAQAGVKLTPAGAAFPHGRDPEDRNIRIAPSFPPLADVDRAMQVFVTCVKLAAARRRIGQRH